MHIPTVTPEERARMRREIDEDSLVVHYCVKPEHMLEMLDTMDALETRAVQAEAALEFLAAITANLQGDAMTRDGVDPNDSCTPKYWVDLAAKEVLIRN